ncbi:MAG: hypothetical protein H7831_12555 [Magnetococcus sp. WYHC-3]
MSEEMAIAALVRQTLEQMNQDLPGASRLDLDNPELVLAGTGGVLDSLHLAMFLVGLDQAIQARYGVTLQLVLRAGEWSGPGGPLGHRGRFCQALAGLVAAHV